MSWEEEVMPHFTDERIFTAAQLSHICYGPDRNKVRSGKVSAICRKAVKYGFIRCVGWTKAQYRAKSFVYTAYDDVLPMNTEDDYVPL